MVSNTTKALVCRGFEKEECTIEFFPFVEMSDQRTKKGLESVGRYTRAHQGFKERRSIINSVTKSFYLQMSTP